MCDNALVALTYTALVRGGGQEGGVGEGAQRLALAVSLDWLWSSGRKECPAHAVPQLCMYAACSGLRNLKQKCMQPAASVYGTSKKIKRVTALNGGGISGNRGIVPIASANHGYRNRSGSAGAGNGLQARDKCLSAQPRLQ